MPDTARPHPWERRPARVAPGEPLGAARALGAAEGRAGSLPVARLGGGWEADREHARALPRPSRRERLARLATRRGARPSLAGRGHAAGRRPRPRATRPAWRT